MRGYMYNVLATMSTQDYVGCALLFHERHVCSAVLVIIMNEGEKLDLVSHPLAGLFFLFQDDGSTLLQPRGLCVVSCMPRARCNFCAPSHV